MLNSTYNQLLDLSNVPDISPSEFIRESMRIMGYTFIDMGIYIKEEYSDFESPSVGFILGWLKNSQEYITLSIWEGHCDNGYYPAIKIKDAPPLLRMLDSFLDSVNEYRLDKELK